MGFIYFQQEKGTKDFFKMDKSMEKGNTFIATETIILGIGRAI